LRTSLNASSFVVTQLVCSMSFESDDDLELYPHVELELRAESRRSCCLAWARHLHSWGPRTTPPVLL
jgi:hypothetical protein